MTYTYPGRALHYRAEIGKFLLITCCLILTRAGTLDFVKHSASYTIAATKAYEVSNPDSALGLLTFGAFTACLLKTT